MCVCDCLGNVCRGSGLWLICVCVCDYEFETITLINMFFLLL